MSDVLLGLCGCGGEKGLGVVVVGEVEVELVESSEDQWWIKST